MPTNKSLGQHWLSDRATLSAIAGAAELHEDDTVLEIGPGLGTLTSELLRHVKKVVAVEFDAERSIFASNLKELIMRIFYSSISMRCQEGTKSLQMSPIILQVRS